MGPRDVAVLIKLGDSVRNSALGLLITLPSIGGIREILGFMAEFRLEPAGNTAKY